MRPTINSNDKLKFDFPNGGYIVDDVKLKIKYDGKDIQLSPEFQLSDLFAAITSKQLIRMNAPRFTDDKNELNDRIPMEFVDAYNKSISKGASSGSFNLPLLRLVSVLYRFSPNCESFVSTPKFSIYKSAQYRESIRKILEQCGEPIESKLEFIIYYRETELFSGMGKGVSPDPVRPYILDKHTVELCNQVEHTVAINDTGSKLDYTHIIVVLDNPDSTLAQVKLDKQNPILTQIKLNTNFSPGSRIGKQFSKLSNSTYVLTKEIAEMYGRPFQTSNKTYLIDVKQYIDTYVKLFIDNNIETMSEAQNIFSDFVASPPPSHIHTTIPMMGCTQMIIQPEDRLQIQPNVQMIIQPEDRMQIQPNVQMQIQPEDSFDTRSYSYSVMEKNLFHKSEEFRVQKPTFDIHTYDVNPITNLRMYLTLTFDAPYKGNVTIYLF
jgi:hypothetical protein